MRTPNSSRQRTGRGRAFGFPPLCYPSIALATASIRAEGIVSPGTSQTHAGGHPGAAGTARNPSSGTGGRAVPVFAFRIGIYRFAARRADHSCGFPGAIGGVRNPLFGRDPWGASHSVCPHPPGLAHRYCHRDVSGKNHSFPRDRTTTPPRHPPFGRGGFHKRVPEIFR
jgi:hypothetical protein